jgi:hypothetical protein
MNKDIIASSPILWRVGHHCRSIHNFPFIALSQSLMWVIHPTPRYGKSHSTPYMSGCTSPDASCQADNTTNMSLPTVPFHRRCLIIVRILSVSCFTWNEGHAKPPLSIGLYITAWGMWRLNFIRGRRTRLTIVFSFRHCCWSNLVTAAE